MTAESLLWLVPLGVVAAGLWRPHAGLLVLAATLPLFGSPPGGPYLAPLDVAALGAIVTAWRAGRPVPGWLDRAALAFVLVSIASMLPIPWRPPSWRPGVLLGLLAELPDVETWSSLYGWRALLSLLLGWGLYLAGRRALGRERVGQLGVALAAGVALTTVVGLAERLRVLSLASYRPIGAPLYDDRLHSFFLHSGWLAEYLVVAAPFAVAAVAMHGRRGRLAAECLGALALASLVLTLQRGGWYAGAAVLLAYAGLVWRRLRQPPELARAGAVVVVAAAIVLLLPAPVTEWGSGDRALEGRVEAAAGDLSGRPIVWRAAARMGAERPVLGWGVGSFVPVHAAGYAAGAWHGRFWLTAHNLYLMVWAERGALGLLTLLALGGIAVTGLVRAWYRKPDPEHHRLLAGLLLSAAAFAIYGMVQYMFFLRTVEWLWWLQLAAVGGLAPVAASRASTRTRRWAVAAAVGLMIVAGVRALAVDSPPRQGDRAYGWHAVEGEEGAPRRWTAGRAAIRLPRRNDTLTFELANGHPRPASHPVTVQLRLDGREVRRLRLDRPGWRRVELPTPAHLGPEVVLEIHARPTFRPFRDLQRHPGLPRSRDIRRLGVAVRGVPWPGDDPTASSTGVPGSR